MSLLVRMTSFTQQCIKRYLNDVLLFHDIGLCSVRRVNEQGKLISFLLNSEKTKSLILVCWRTSLNLSGPYMCNRLYSKITGVAEQKFPWRQNLNEDMIININAASFKRSECI